MTKEHDCMDHLAVRWLAALCGLPHIEIFPSLASTLLRRETHAAAVTAHAAWWARHPNPAGQFGRSVRFAPETSDVALTASLAQQGYDGLLYLEDGEVVGHF